MKALVKTKPEPGIWAEDLPTPEVGPNDVRIKIQKTAICGTDIHIFKWDKWAQKTIHPPLVIGHEFVGVVEKLGQNVHDVRT
ncbi:MAG TPA: alcohol dehydrogenase catalytic domain-containing protein, partial [Sedimentisphaerales bacterium]|nr:alcohol dehydrogenase catalytic domain-containing protein [Sedimentisphaerales bacterium]